MSNYNFDNPQDGEWDDRGEIFWNEFDWKKYLERHEEEIKRFRGLYNQHLNEPNHLDAVAQMMGWDMQDWTPADEDGLDETDFSPEEDAEDFDPYTLHRHPVYVVTRALFRELRELWENYYKSMRPNASRRAIWDYATHLGECETGMILAVQSMDMGDYSLSVMQLKHTLVLWNKVIHALATLTEPPSLLTMQVREASRFRLFDLREMCLRVMNDCRMEMQRPDGDADMD